jgi:hypothetical protein
VDIHAQVSARRAELEQQQREAADQAARRAQDQRAAEQQQRLQAMDRIAGDLSINGVAVSHVDGELHIAPSNPAPLDVTALKQSKLKGLLNREARKRWSPGDNWLVISLIVVGICTILMRGLGLVLIAIGFWRRHVLNKRYRVEVRALHPGVFTDLQP